MYIFCVIHLEKKINKQNMEVEKKKKRNGQADIQFCWAELSEEREK